MCPSSKSILQCRPHHHFSRFISLMSSATSQCQPTVTLISPSALIQRATPSESDLPLRADQYSIEPTQIFIFKVKLDLHVKSKTCCIFMLMHELKQKHMISKLSHPLRKSFSSLLHQVNRNLRHNAFKDFGCWVSADCRV